MSRPGWYSPGPPCPVPTPKVNSPALTPKVNSPALSDHARDPKQPKVCDDHFAVVIEDVLGFEIFVHDALGVEIAHTLGDRELQVSGAGPRLGRQLEALPKSAQAIFRTLHGRMVSMVPMRKPSLREGKSLAPGHTAVKEHG